jgi:hypothetical protein
VRSVYIGHIECSPAVEEKIDSKHSISLQDVRDAVQWPAPVDEAEGTWRLGTAVSSGVISP